MHISKNGIRKILKLKYFKISFLWIINKYINYHSFLYNYNFHRQTINIIHYMFNKYINNFKKE